MNIFRAIALLVCCLVAGLHAAGARKSARSVIEI